MTVEVVLDGELDLSTFDAAQQRVEEAESAQPELLVVDLSRLTFVDSTGVRLVLLADARARDAGRRLAVRLGDGSALRVFASLGLLEKLDVLPAAQPAPDSATR
jgi:anti-sigma B factor antagonist